MTVPAMVPMLTPTGRTVDMVVLDGADKLPLAELAPIIARGHQLGVIDDLAAAQSAMSETEVNARWQATTKPFFEGLNGNPDEGLKLVPMVFNLEDQLRASGQSL